MSFSYRGWKRKVGRAGSYCKPQASIFLLHSQPLVLPAASGVPWSTDISLIPKGQGSQRNHHLEEPESFPWKWNLPDMNLGFSRGTQNTFLLLEAAQFIALVTDWHERHALGYAWNSYSDPCSLCSGVICLFTLRYGTCACILDVKPMLRTDILASF